MCVCLCVCVYVCVCVCVCVREREREREGGERAMKPQCVYKEKLSLTLSVSPDAMTVIGFLRTYGLENEIKVCLLCDCR